MIVIYVHNEKPTHSPIRFHRRAAEFASKTSDALCHPDFGPSASVWLVPGTGDQS